MSFFERLKSEASAEWRAYTEHPFTAGLADGTLPEGAFRHYLVQDYLFLIEFARAYALAVYKSIHLADMREAASGLSAILDVEMDLHVKLCAGWGLSPATSSRLHRLRRRWPIPVMCSTRECGATYFRSKLRSHPVSSAMRRSRDGSRKPMHASRRILIGSGLTSMQVRHTKRSQQRRGRIWITLPLFMSLPGVKPS